MLLYLLSFIILTIYSFSQVDLNLNLSKNETYLILENFMKQVGYFNRPLSFWIFILISTFLILFYTVAIIKITKNNLKVHPRSFIFYLLLLIFYLLAYPAFLSYDIFNYFFDARIVIKYHENPYLFSAGRYVFDEWLRFMRWTHRTYPYGPVWLVVSLVPVFLGFGKLVPTIFFFKVFNLAIFLGCVYFLKKILLSVKANINQIYLFALHPVIIYDFLLSMHNEGLMLFFLLASIYFFLKEKRLAAIILLLLSAGVKYLTIVFLPIYIFYWFIPARLFLHRLTPCLSRLLVVHPRAGGDPDSFKNIINISLIIYFLALIFLSTQREFYSWYFIVPIGLLVLNPNKLSRIMLFVLSFLIFRCAPFILIGEYNQTVLFWQNAISYATIGLLFLPACIEAFSCGKIKKLWRFHSSDNFSHN